MTEIITDYLDAKQLADRLTALELHSTSELARLERERDEAQEELEEYRSIAENIGAVKARTPETDDFELNLGDYSNPWKAIEFARKLERERDEANDELHKQLVQFDQLFDEAEKIRRERDEAREEAHRFRSLSYARSGIDKSASWFPWETSLNLAQKAHWRKQNENRL